MEWSQTHYNLIVNGNINNPIFHNATGQDTFPAQRLFESTANELKTKYASARASLSEMLALVVAERGFGTGAQPAFLTRIDQIQNRGRNVHFQFEHLLGGFTSEEVFNSGYFDIHIDSRGIDEAHRTHWAVKEGNLVEGVLKLVRGQPKGEGPRLFNVEQWPLPVLGHVAVMMPFDQAFNTVYTAIQSACEDSRLQALRVNEIYGPNKIIDDIFKTIGQSKLVISDLTGRNPNVLYETGLAHALDRDVIMIVQNNQDVPFDLGHIRHVPYLSNQEGLEKLKADLRQTIQAIEG